MKRMLFAPGSNHVYVGGAYNASAGYTDAITLFDRAADGTLTRRATPTAKDGCIAWVSGGWSAGSCRTARAIGVIRAWTMSPDGKQLYVTGDQRSIAIIDRDPATGLLSERAVPNGCITETGRATYTSAATAGQCRVGGVRAARALRPRAHARRRPGRGRRQLRAQRRRPDPAAALLPRRRDRAQPRRQRRPDDDRLLQRDAPLARFRAADDRRVRDRARARQPALDRADHAGRQARVLRRRAVRHAVARQRARALQRHVGQPAGARPRRARRPPRRSRRARRTRSSSSSCWPRRSGRRRSSTRPTTRPRRPAPTTARAAGRWPSRQGQTTATVSVPITQDATPEPPETFGLRADRGRRRGADRARRHGLDHRRRRPPAAAGALDRRRPRSSRAACCASR